MVEICPQILEKMLKIMIKFTTTMKTPMPTVKAMTTDGGQTLIREADLSRQINDIIKIEYQLIKWLLFCLFVFTFHSRIFHTYGDFTITGKRLQILTYARYSGH